MAPIDQKQRVERHVLDLLGDAGLPLPDRVVYEAAAVRFLWLDRKLVLVVDLDDDLEDVLSDGHLDREDVAA